jgi:uncharacterized protein (DUF4415 family)
MTMARSDMQNFSRYELQRKRDAGQTETKPDAPAYAVPDGFWDGATLRTPGKTHISMRIDTDVLDWYRQQGEGYLTRMNSVLRSFMEQMGDRQKAPSATQERRAKTQKSGSRQASPEAVSPVSARRKKTS